MRPTTVILILILAGFAVWYSVVGGVSPDGMVTTCEYSLQDQARNLGKSSIDLLAEVKIENNDFASITDRCSFKMELGKLLFVGAWFKGQEVDDVKAMYLKHQNSTVEVHANLDKEPSAFIGEQLRKPCNLSEKNWLLFLKRADGSEFFDKKELNCRFAYLRPRKDKQQILDHLKN